MIELPELIDAIVDQVAQTEKWHQEKDRGTLKACALTVRRLLVPSQRHLFQSFTLSNHNMENVCAGMLHNPSLASYIRDFCLSMGYGLSESCGQLLVGFFPLLTRLDRLVIDCGFYHFDSLQPAALTGLFSFPTIRCFGVKDCPGLPPSVIRHAVAAYEGVAFTNVEIGQEDEYAVSLFPAPPSSWQRLRRLALEPFNHTQDGCTLKDFILSEGIAPFLSNLEHLELRVFKAGSLGGLEGIAHFCCGSIQRLAIDFFYYPDTDIGPLPIMPAIRVLTLSSCVRRLRLPHALRSVILSLPTRMPKLERINVVLDSHIFEYKEHHRPDIDEALNNLPRLRQLHFTIACHSSSAIEDSFREALPLAGRAGLLSFETSFVRDMQGA
ncbi:hypothetical protein FB45DRAFT_864125 [Roridomyces roridus]|uniref:Uncharacterized protein n=1 Tax=Roridomyces roridus TaxID=1738132 RepID=A0AAD7FVK8_9AGAR|nr:hypothetical protein FB45DRAFT_864125 [Roridomyces roridus]